MKRNLLTTVFVLTVTILFAQNNFQDVVYLKNGSIIRGIIVEQIPNESLKIETADGSLFVFRISDVERMTRERVEVSQQTATAPHSIQQEQTPVRRREFGVKGGLNVASQMVSEGRSSSQTDARLGIHIGFFVELPISTRVSFQPELLYSMQGGKYGVGRHTYTDRIDYINLPLMFKFYIWQQRLSIDVGPQFGYMISAKVSRDGNSVSFYDFEGLNKFDISLALGLSFRLTDKINLGLRGTAGLTSILEGGDSNYTNSVSQLSIAFRF